MDLRHAMRLILRQPAFGLMACAALALGIGANVAVFSVVDAALFRPLPYRDPDRLVHVFTGARLRAGGVGFVDTTGRRASDLRMLGHIFEDAAAFSYSANTLLADATVPTVRLGGLSPTFAQFLGVSLARGRHCTSRDAAADDVVLISEDYWRRQFGRDVDVIGHSISFADRPRVIVGVLPTTFRYFVGAGTDAWRCVAERDAGAVVARLRPGLDLQAAQRELDAALGRGALAWKPVGVQLTPAEWNRAQPTARAMLYALLGGVALLLLIACANVAGLLLGRTYARQREIVVRHALGATGRRLAQQFLAEGLAVAAVGGTVGTFIAWLTVRALPGLVPQDLVYTILGVALPQLDGRVLAFGLAVTAVSAMVCAAMPASRAAGAHRWTVDAGLRIAGTTRRQRQVGHLFQFVQVAFTTVISAGAVALLSGFVRMSIAPVGFDAEHLASIHFASGPGGRQPEGTRVSEFVERLRALPWVAAATPGHPPVSGLLGGTFLPVDDVLGGGRPAPRVETFHVRPDYFGVAGIVLRDGRPFRVGDDARMAVVSEAVARRFWPQASAIGKRFRTFESAEPYTIIGVAATTRTLQIATNAAVVYLPMQPAEGTTAVTIKLAGDPAVALAAIAGDVRRLATGLDIRRITLVEDLFAEFDPLGPSRFFGALAAVLATIGVVIATVGLYAQTSTSVSRRTREIGVRLALGASAARVRAIIVIDALVPVAAGLVAGLLGSVWLVRFLAAQQSSVRADDPLSLAGLALMFLVASAIASYTAARRASRADPVAALRAE